jgi:prepilin-type N-terminal cleavage/methylation domain-containing protein
MRMTPPRAPRRGFTLIESLVVTAVFAGGPVRAVPYSIDPAVLTNLAAINDGNVVPDWN